MKFKDIHIGKMIERRVAENGIKTSHISNFLKCPEEEIPKMYMAKSLDTESLLRWSKLLEYDFFRIYTQHLILYAPTSAVSENIGNRSSQKQKNKNTALPKFRKNIYTKEIIDYILEQIDSGKMTKNQVIDCYKIPKTTLYKWIEKYDL